VFYIEVCLGFFFWFGVGLVGVFFFFWLVVWVGESVLTMIGFTTSLGGLGKKGLERATLSKGGRIALVRSARRVVVRKQETKYDEVMQKEQQVRLW